MIPRDEDEVVVFIASKHTSSNYRRVLWRVTRADAKKICNDPRTSGQRHMLCWTDQNIDDPTINRYVPDSGATDDVLRTTTSRSCTARDTPSSRPDRDDARR